MTTFDWTSLTDKLKGDEVVRVLNVRMPRVARSILARQSDLGLITITESGAAGSGLVDDAANVQRAVNKIPAAGGIVWGTPGKVYLLGSTITVPNDRLVVIAGGAGFWANNFGGLTGGTSFRRKSSFTSGPLFSQDGAGALIHGMRMLDVVLDGQGLAGDLVQLTDTGNVHWERVWFVNAQGNGLAITGMYNSKFAFCRFYELGLPAASTYAIKMLSHAAAAPNNIEFVAPEFEVGEGGYVYCSDPTGTHPVDQIKFVGGKMEFSGNLSGNTPGVPFMDINNATKWDINGMQFMNGRSHGATHIKLTNSTQVKLDTLHAQDTTTDALNPQYYVHVVSASDLTIKGIYYRGGGNSGAQVRVQGSCNEIRVDPTNLYISPLNSGLLLDSTVTMGATGPQTASRQAPAIALPYSASIDTNASRGDIFTITPTDGVAFQVNNPTNGTDQQELTYGFHNTAGAPMGVVTFDTEFRLSGAFTAPADTFWRFYTFKRFASTPCWREVYRSAADQAN